MKNANILIVEDDVIAQMALSQMLQDMGYTNVTTSSNTKETIDILSEQSVDVAILDVFLYGERGGIDIARHINEKYGIPLIFITASYDPETFSLMNETQHKGILEKPYEYEDIKNAISKIIESEKEVASDREFHDTNKIQNIDVLNSVFDEVAIGICIVDQQNRFLKANEAFCELFEYSCKELIQTDLTKLLPEIRQNAAIDKVTLGNKSVWEQSILSKHGRIIDASITTSKFLSQESNYVVVTVTDISHQKENTKELEKQIEENKSLTAEIHHRVKNSLNTVSGLLYLKEQAYDQPDIRGVFQRIRQRVQTLASIHGQFFKGDLIKFISSRDFIKALIYKSNKDFDMRLAIDSFDAVEEFFINNDLGIRLGLVVNELLMNVINHAYANGEEKKVMMSLKALDSSSIELQIRDAGKGFRQKSTENLGLGFKIIRSICGKENVTLKDHDGASITIRLHR